MPYRKIVFATDEIYHVLNRGVAHAPIFSSPRDYQRFLALLNFYRYANPLFCFSHYERLTESKKRKFMENLKEKGLFSAEVLAFCLMPNHFHLLLIQTADNGISKMLARIQNGYARYFNLKKKRQGPLFQSMFKAVLIETDEQLLHVSRYIHLNPSSSYLVKIKNLPLYSWSSFPEYLGKRSSVFTNPELVLSLAGGIKKYKQFVFDQAEYQRDLSKVKHLALELPSRLPSRTYRSP